MKVVIAIVTYESREVLGLCLEALTHQDYPISKICIFDCHSSNIDFLDSALEEYSPKLNIKIVKSDINLGYAGGNNQALKELQSDCSDWDTLLILNPDVFLDKSFFNDIFKKLKNNPQWGICGGHLLQYSLEKKEPTGKSDSRGIGRHFYGRWFDLAQGNDADLPLGPEVKRFALCGAMLLLKRSAVNDLIKKNGYLFNPKYFMYKEDVELCLRLKKMGYQVEYIHEAEAWHCRGWAKKRKEMSYQARLFSARNDLRLAMSYIRSALPYSLAKYLYVRFFEVR